MFRTLPCIPSARSSQTPNSANGFDYSIRAKASIDTTAADRAHASRPRHNITFSYMSRPSGRMPAKLTTIILFENEYPLAARLPVERSIGLRRIAYVPMIRENTVRFNAALRDKSGASAHFAN